MPTKKHNIDSLFEKAKSDFGNLDDFEKDAISGIENYSSITNVKELQNNLKRRFEKEILKKSKKKPPTFYWLAAATLAFLIGLSVFFIFNSNQKFSKSKKLAINIPKENVKFSNTHQIQFLQQIMCVKIMPPQKFRKKQLIKTNTKNPIKKFIHR